MANKTAESSMKTLFKNWEVKDRIYVLTRKATPVSFQLRSRHTPLRPLEYFDEDQAIPRALRYVTNQTTVFEDEQVDNYVLGEILFEDGELKVPGRNTILQQFLALHPDNVANGGGRFEEFDPEKTAKKRIAEANKGFEAVAVAMNMGPETLEAVGRVVFPDRVDTMTTSEIKFEVLQFAQRSPEKFNNIANNSNIQLQNLVVKAIKLGLIKIKDDNVTVVWRSNGREIVTLPFSNDPVQTLAVWLKTDDGISTMEAITDKLT